MLAFTIPETKNFMEKLLKENTFDSFSLRQFQVKTFTEFQISGLRNKAFYTLDEQEQDLDDFCSWGELKRFAFSTIKGSRLPKSIKLIFSLTQKDTQVQFPNASVLFLNLIFEENALKGTTGVGQKNFSLDRTQETLWEEWVTRFFKENGIAIVPLT